MRQFKNSNVNENGLMASVRYVYESYAKAIVHLHENEHPREDVTVHP